MAPISLRISTDEATVTCQCGKLNFWSTRPKTDVPYMFYTKFHLPRPIFYSPSSKCTRIGEHKFPSLHVWMSNKNPWKITNINQIKQGTTKQIQIEYFSRADSRFVPSHCNISHWLGARLESVLFMEYTTSWRIQSRNTAQLGRISFSFSCWGYHLCIL